MELGRHGGDWGMSDVKGSLQCYSYETDNSDVSYNPRHAMSHEMDGLLTSMLW